MADDKKLERQGQGEAAGRERGYEENGGRPGNDLLEDGQLRGVDEDGQVTTGTHGGPTKRKDKEPPTNPNTPGQI